eukprot:283045_1
MSNESIKIEIKNELISFLQQLSHDELKKQTKKKCKAYLEEKLNISLSKYKSHIKFCLSQFITNYVNSNNNKPKSKCNTNTPTNIPLKKISNTKSNTSNTRKRKINGCMDSIPEPPSKKLKQCPIPNDNIIPNKQIKTIHSPKTDDYKDGEIINIDKNENKSSEKSKSKCISNNIESIDNMKEMTSLIYAENLMYSLNEELSAMKDEKDKENINYDNIEYDALKNKLQKCNEECIKCKELVKKYAGLLQPKIVMCGDLKKENDILNKNIEILKNNHVKEINKMKNCLKNESENVKEERFKCLRKDKYIQRLQKKFDFICNKYNIDRDSVVVEMNQ